MKLVSTTRGANANTLRSSALAPCYSVDEYCAAVWAQSAHTNLVDVQLNSTMRLISGTLKPTPLPWLPVLANIEPLALRRKAAVDKLLTKATTHETWGLYGDIINRPALRLSSRHPLWIVGNANPEVFFETRVYGFDIYQTRVPAGTRV